MRRFFIGSKSGEQDKSNKSDNIHLSKDLRNKINLFYLLTWNNEEVNIDDGQFHDFEPAWSGVYHGESHEVDDLRAILTFKSVWTNEVDT